MSMLQWRSRSWVYLCAWPSSPQTDPCGLEMRRTVRRPGELSKGSVFPCAVVLGWGSGIFHRPGLLQVPLALPDAFAWGKAAAPASPAGRTGAFSEQLLMLEQAGLCCQTPCPAPREDPLAGQHFLLISCILGSSGRVYSLEGGISSSSPPIPCPAAGGSVHGGRVGVLGLVVHLTAPFLKAGLGHCRRAVALAPGSEQRRWQG